MCNEPAPRPRENGAAAVEFALVVPLLLVLVFGIISYGYMLSFRQALSQGAAEGARAAAVAASTATPADKVTAAREAVNESLGSYGVSCVGTSLQRNGTASGTCSVAIGPCTNNPTKSCATVTLDYAYREHSLTGDVPGAGVTLPASLAYTAVAQVS